MLKKLLRILLIEDNIDHVELLSDVIERHFAPIDLHTVETIDDAMDFVSQTEYDIVFTDCYINDASIVDQIPKLRAKLKNTPMIVITGSGDEKLAAEVIKKGATDYLVKTKDSLEMIPALIKKYTKDGKLTEPSVPTKKDSNVLKQVILDEMSVLNKAAKEMTTTKPGGGLPDVKQLESLLDQIQRLKELASRLMEK